MDNRPIIFLGTNNAIEKYTEICKENGLEVKGIIDKDYYGNCENFCGIPVLDSEDSFNDSEKSKYYKENYNFFCATNWMPMENPVIKRNKEKRFKFLELIEKHNLNCINIIDQRAKVSPSAKIGKGVFIAEFVSIESNVVIEDFVNIYTFAIIGHHSFMGRNSIAQRGARMCGNVTVQENCYLALHVLIYKPHVTIAAGSFIHNCIYLTRDTVPGEIVSLPVGNTDHVRGHPIIDVNN